jgi:opacity protein-like surface antigen
MPRFASLLTLLHRTLGQIGLAVVLAGSIFFVLIARPAQAQFSDVAYTLEPTVIGVFEADDGAFQNAPLYGGALGFSFGRRLQVSGEYLFNTNATSDFSQIGGLDGLVDRDLDVRRYGGRLRLNLFDRQVLPYLTAGTGVLQFDPEGVEQTSTLYAVGGVGMTFEAQNRYRVSVGGEMMGYRYDPVATFLGPSAEGGERGQRLVRSPTLTASLSLYLGGRSLSEQTIVDQQMKEQFGGGGLRGVQLFVQPFYGRLTFNEALGMPKNQNLAGVNAGVEFGPYVGLRGFYWRGTTGDDVFDEFAGGFEGMELYGSELRLRLNANAIRGFVPYTTVGGGYLNVLEGYEDDIPAEASSPENRFFATVGGGLEVPITRGLKVSGGVRSILTGNPSAGDVPRTDQTIYGSFLYSAGLEFRIGGGGRSPTPPPEDPRLPPSTPVATQEGEHVEDTSGQAMPARTPEATASESTSDDLNRLLAKIESLEQALNELRREPADSPEVDPSAERRAENDGRTMTVPVPESGEIYVRFGSDATPQDREQAVQNVPPDTTQLERQIREAVRQELQAQSSADTTDVSRADLDQIVRQALRDAEAEGAEARARDLQQREAQQRTIQRLEDEIADLRQQVRRQSEDVLRARRDAAERTVPTRAAPSRSAAEESGADSPPFYRQVLGRPLTYVAPVTGFRMGEGPNQLQLGVRADYRVRPAARFHLMPEVTFGVGSGRRTGSLLINGAYSVLEDRAVEWTGAPLEPYAGVGLGILSDGGLEFEVVTNVMLGTSYRFRTGQTAFVELSTLGTFDTNRIVVGYRFPM